MIKNKYVTLSFCLGKIWDTKPFSFENSWKIISTNTIIYEWNIYLYLTLENQI